MQDDATPATEPRVRVDRPVSRPSNARVLLTPGTWLRNYRTCPYLSAFINAALDDGHKPEVVDLHHIRLAGKTLWRANYPYAFANVGDAMPDRKTVLRLNDAMAAAEWEYGPVNG